MIDVRAPKSAIGKISALDVLLFALSFICGLLFALCYRADAQQQVNVPRIGFLIPGTEAAFSVRTDAIRQGLRDLGYVEGKNLVIEYRYNDGNVGRLPELAAELARLKVEVIFAVGTDAAQAAKSATKNIPIVVDRRRSRWDQARCQPGAARRKHHWALHPQSGALRQTARATQGGGSQDFSHRSDAKLDYSEYPDRLERDRGGGAIIEGAASFHGGASSRRDRRRLLCDDKSRRWRVCRADGPDVVGVTERRS